MKSLCCALLLLTATPLSAQDRPFQIAKAVYVTAAMADLAVTEYRLGQGGVREAGLGRGLEQQPIAFGLVKGSLTAGALVAFQRLHKSKPKLATALVIAFTAIESYAALHNRKVWTR